MENKEIISNYLNEVDNGINQNAKSVNQKIPQDSTIEADNDGGTLSKAAHMQYLIKGQGSAPGKMRPVEPILDWIIRENIKPSPIENKDGTFRIGTQESMAWAISYSLSLHGSQIYQGKKPGVDLKSVLNDKTPKLLSDLGKNVAASIASALRNATIILLVLFCSCSHRVGVTKEFKENLKNVMNEKNINPLYLTLSITIGLVFVNVMTKGE